MLRALSAFTLLLASVSSVLADFTITGNPTVDPGWTQESNSLTNGNYVRGGANFNFNIWTAQFRVPFGVNPLTTMPDPWNPRDQVIGIGGTFSSPLTPAELGWPAILGATQNSLIGANTRITAKYGVDYTGVGGNAYSASTLNPNLGDGLGSHALGNGGVGSVQVSIAANRFVPANAGVLTLPTITTGGLVTGPDDVAQYGVPPGPGVGANGLDLVVGNDFPAARYIFLTDPGTGFLTSWEVLLDATMVGEYPGALTVLSDGRRQLDHVGASRQWSGTVHGWLGENRSVLRRTGSAGVPDRGIRRRQLAGPATTNEIIKDFNMRTKKPTDRILIAL